MKSLRNKTQKKLLGFLSGIVLFFGLSYLVLTMATHTPVQAPTNTQPESPDNFASERASLHGTVVCLPLMDQAGPQTDECALGLKTDIGHYYALDFNLFSAGPVSVKAGNKLVADGLLTPIEMLSTNHWQRYPIKGIFSVTDSVEINGKKY